MSSRVKDFGHSSGYVLVVQSLSRYYLCHQSSRGVVQDGQGRALAIHEHVVHRDCGDPPLLVPLHLDYVVRGGCPPRTQCWHQDLNGMWVSSCCSTSRLVGWFGRVTPLASWPSVGAGSAPSESGPNISHSSCGSSSTSPWSLVLLSSFPALPILRSPPLDAVPAVVDIMHKLLGLTGLHRPCWSGV